MKAKCIKNFIDRTENGMMFISVGHIVDYDEIDKEFIVNGISMTSTRFFLHFRVIDGNSKLNYSDFEYILCNHIFDCAVFFPSEYSGVHHLIIQNWNNSVIMITSNKYENTIRVSFGNSQTTYETYEDALDAIIAHGYTQ